jgi:hypothetical protein
MSGSKRVPLPGRSSAPIFTQNPQPAAGPAQPAQAEQVNTGTNAVMHAPHPPAHTARESARRKAIENLGQCRGVKRPHEDGELNPRSVKKPKRKPTPYFFANLPDFPLRNVLADTNISLLDMTNIFIADPRLQKLFPNDEVPEEQCAQGAHLHLVSVIKNLKHYPDLIGSLVKVFGIESDMLHLQLEQVAVACLEENLDAAKHSDCDFQQLLNLVGLKSPELIFELANVFIQQLPFTKKGREMLQPSTDINAPAPDLLAMAERFGLTEPEHIDVFIDETEELLEDTGREPLESRIIRACTKNPMFEGASATALAHTYEITSAQGRSQLEHYALLTGSSVQMMVKQGFNLDKIVELHGLVDPVVIEEVKKEIAKQDETITRIANMRL